MDHVTQNIDKIESWLDKKGFVLCKSKKPTIEDEVCFDRKVVFLSLRSSSENQLYSLLHECGHVILRTRKGFKQRFRATDAIEQGRTTKETNRSIVEQIEEEILAWREGFTLAKKLEIQIKDEPYYRYGFRWVMSYIVLGAIGKEHYLPNSLKINIEDNNIETKISELDICKLLDNVHPVCYNGVISKPEQQDQ